jgi:hypothetical protein
VISPEATSFTLAEMIARGKKDNLPGVVNAIFFDPASMEFVVTFSYHVENAV